MILCRAKGADWFFLPGGHVENGESIKNAISRELHEEIGEGDYAVSSFIGICENIFSLKEDVLQHEMNIIFEVNVPHNYIIISKEDHIEFVNVRKNELEKYKILPIKLKEGLGEWLKNKEVFLKEI